MGNGKQPIKEEPEASTAGRRAAVMDEVRPSGGGFTFDGTGDYNEWRTWALGQAMFMRRDPEKAAQYLFGQLRGGPAVAALISVLDQAHLGKSAANKAEADQQLIRLRQGSRELGTFLADFQRLAAQSNFSAAMQVSFLKAAVSGRLAPFAAMISEQATVGEAVTQLRQVDRVAPRTPHPNKQGTGGGKAKGRGVKTKKDASDVECFECHEKGHYKRDCPSKGKTRGRKAEQIKADEGDDAQLEPYEGNE
jgi:hypothetical protein